MRFLFCLLLLSAAAPADADGPTLAERVTSINEDLLAGYIQPLVNAFGAGVSTGLFQSAYSHEFLGFDIGVRFMSIRIPEAAKYFDGAALLCSLTVDSLVYYEVPIEGLSTVFGPDTSYTVPVEGYAISIPAVIPGGFELSSAPLVMPQLNVGLPFGAELALRYLPFTFEGTRMNFFGIGVKQELNKFPLFKPIPLPVAVAVGAAYQRFDIENQDRQVLANSGTWNLQLLVSKRIGPLEPTIGFGVENTRVHFDYTFEYEIPDTISGMPYERLTVEQDISLDLTGQNRYRTIIGGTLRLGALYLHYDYNIATYATHNAGLGFSFR